MLTFTIEVLPEHGSLYLPQLLDTKLDASTSFSSSSLLYRPSKDFHGNDTFTYRATTSDGRDSVESAKILILVFSVYDPAEIQLHDADLLLEPFRVLNLNAFEFSQVLNVTMDAGEDVVVQPSYLDNVQVQTDVEIADGAVSFVGRIDGINSAISEVGLKFHDEFTFHNGSFSVRVDEDNLDLPLIASFSSVPRIIALSPTSVTIHGGAYLEVQGNYLGSDVDACIIDGTYSVPTEVLSNYKVRCVMPPIPKGPTTVSLVTVGGIHSNPISVYVKDALIPTGISPTFSTLQGQSEIQISYLGGVGDTFHGLYCRFDETIVAARLLAESRLSCVAPLMGSAGTVPLSIAINQQEFQ